MEWINEKAKTLKQGAIRAMFDRANTMTGVISLGIGEPDMPTPKLVCEAAKEALDKGDHALYAERRYALVPSGHRREVLSEGAALRPEHRDHHHKRRHGRAEPAVPCPAEQGVMKS